MSNQNIKQITFRKEVEVIISPQAQKILAGTKYSLEDFKNWSLNEQKISLGGNNVAIFLEAMYNQEKALESETSKNGEVTEDENNTEQT